MQPQPVEPFTPSAPSGHAATRAARALLVEHRLPYAISSRLDRLLASVGQTDKTVSVGSQRVTVRRGTNDENFVHNVLVEQEYFRAGYEPHAGDTIVDVGANIGTFTLAAKSRAPGCRVVAVEPFPANLSYLRRNIEQNALPGVQVVPAAIGAEDGEGRLFVGPDTGLHSMKFDRGRGYVDVEVLSLSTLFDRCGVEECDLLKIDCEGAEFDFLPSLDASVWSRVRRVAMEFSAPIPDWVFDRPTAAQRERKRELGDQLVDLLEQHGFRIDAYLDCVGFRAGYLFATQS